MRIALRRTSLFFPLAFYARQYQRWNDGLPSRSMRRIALPEGVFAQPQGDEVAEIEIPFVVR